LPFITLLVTELLPGIDTDTAAVVSRTLRHASLDMPRALRHMLPTYAALSIHVIERDTPRRRFRLRCRYCCRAITMLVFILQMPPAMPFCAIRLPVLLLLSAAAAAGYADIC